MDSLFDALPTNKYEPLPVRMRPTELDKCLANIISVTELLMLLGFYDGEVIVF